MKQITLATTTSAQDSGLLKQLLPRFEKENGVKVKVISVGSGLAINLAREGKADVLLVHDPEAEQQLIIDGIGFNRKLVMHNDFVLVGPIKDTIGLKDTESIVEAFKKIVATGSIFVSRDDLSGTDNREKLIWKKANTFPSPNNYQRTKGGMAETLAVASAKNGYTLSDRATFLAQKHALDLDIMVEGDELLLNMYNIIQVNPDRFSNINSQGAELFVNFITGSEAQEMIGKFMTDRFGYPIFIPDAGKTAEEIKLNWLNS